MPTIDDDVVIDNLNQVVYSLAEDIDIDSELSLGAKTAKKK